MTLRGVWDACRELDELDRVRAAKDSAWLAFRVGQAERGKDGELQKTGRL